LVPVTAADYAAKIRPQITLDTSPSNVNAKWEALHALDALVAERDTLREALQAISDRGDMVPFDEHCGAVLIAIARAALAATETQP
jgi:hypothetical protein